MIEDQQTRQDKRTRDKTDLKEPNVEFLVFLTIIISVFDGQIFGYKQLPLNIRIGDLCKNW